MERQHFCFRDWDRVDALSMVVQLLWSTFLKLVTYVMFYCDLDGCQIPDKYKYKNINIIRNMFAITLMLLMAADNGIYVD